jgi:hypothetical protein
MPSLLCFDSLEMRDPGVNLRLQSLWADYDQSCLRNHGAVSIHDLSPSDIALFLVTRRNATATPLQLSGEHRRLCAHHSGTAVRQCSHTQYFARQCVKMEILFAVGFLR